MQFKAILYGAFLLGLYAVLCILNVYAFRKLEQNGYDPSNFEKNELTSFLMKRLGIVKATLVTYLIFSFFVTFCMFIGFSEFAFGLACGFLLFNILHDYLVTCEIMTKLKEKGGEPET